MNIRTDAVSDGFVVFDGDAKLAVINTKHHKGLFRDGCMLWEDMPRESWRVHLTSPVQSEASLKAILAALDDRLENPLKA